MMAFCGLSNPILRFHVPTPMARSSISGLPRRKNHTEIPVMIVNKMKIQGSIFHRKRVSSIFQASVVPPPPLQQDSSDELQRNAMCESYGFTQIGEPLPENVTLKNIIDSLPKKVFEIDDIKAWKSVLISVVSYCLGILLISKSPWYLLPLAWAWTGTAVTGFFVIGHDCAHKSFSKNKLLEDIVGTLAFLPLIYPYEPWRFKHDRHHAKTNMLAEDTAWHPVWSKEMDGHPILSMGYMLGYGPLRPWMSIAHWLVWHFGLRKFRPSEVKRAVISVACVFSFMAIGWPLIVYHTGFIGWIKFWLMPWLGYHFWMSTFTMVHHTAPHIPFKTSSTLLTSVDRHRNLTGGPLQGSFECRRRKGKKSFCAGPGDAVELDPIPVLSSTDVAPLKLKLLNAIAGLNKGFAANKEDLKIVESIAKELESARGPVDLTCNIDMLQGRWKLIYSSAFSSGTLGGSRPGPPTGRLLPITLGKVFQRIDVLSKDFDNIVEVEFGTPWPLPKVEATATLAHKFELIGSSQIKIVFIKTTINPTGNLAQIPPIELPRLPDGLRPPSSGSGEGDFEVTYLDVDTRVTRGDRGELRVFVIS